MTKQDTVCSSEENKPSVIPEETDSQESTHNSKEQTKTANPPSLVELVMQAGVELFCDKQDRCYARIPSKGHHEIWPLNSSGFERWLGKLQYDATRQPPIARVCNAAIQVLEGKANYEGERHEAPLRIAERDGAIYLDLCNDKWEVVQIDKHSWRVETDSPVRFMRTPGMEALPIPEKGGDLRDLQKVLNLPAGNDAFILIVAWLLKAFSPNGPSPVLALYGEQGSAKSVTTRAIRALIDPNTSSSRACPTSEQDLFISATNSLVVSIDNLSDLSPRMSDALCRLCTKSGYATRKHYTNGEESVLDAMAPIILNGITEFITRPDLMERSVVIELPAISPGDRITEADFKKKYDEMRPKILGALLDALSMGLRKLDDLEIEELPRMADFTKWVIACEPGLPWSQGAFQEAYSRNQASLVESVLDHPVASAVQSMMWADTLRPMTGTATQFLNLLGDANERSCPNWPRSPEQLGKILRRLAPALRKDGVEIQFDRSNSRNRSRNITITGVKRPKGTTLGQQRTENPGECPNN